MCLNHCLFEIKNNPTVKDKDCKHLCKLLIEIYVIINEFKKKVGV